MEKDSYTIVCKFLETWGETHVVGPTALIPPHVSTTVMHQSDLFPNRG